MAATNKESGEEADGYEGARKWGGHAGAPMLFELPRTVYKTSYSIKPFLERFLERQART